MTEMKISKELQEMYERGDQLKIYKVTGLSKQLIKEAFKKGFATRTTVSKIESFYNNLEQNLKLLENEKQNKQDLVD